MEVYHLILNQFIEFNENSIKNNLQIFPIDTMIDEEILNKREKDIKVDSIDWIKAILTYSTSYPKESMKFFEYLMIREIKFYRRLVQKLCYPLFFGGIIDGWRKEIFNFLKDNPYIINQLELNLDYSKINLKTKKILNVNEKDYWDKSLNLQIALTVALLKDNDDYFKIITSILKNHDSYINID